MGYRLLFALGGALFWVLLGWNVLYLGPATNLGMGVVLAVTLWGLGGVVGPALHLTDTPDQEAGTLSRR